MSISFTEKLFGASRKTGEARLRKTRLIACDLDGTLLNGDEMIGPVAMRRIADIEALGIPFVMITRRHHLAAEPYAELLKMTTPIISLDGSMIALPSTCAPIFTVCPDQEFMRDIVDEIGGTRGADFCAVTPEKFHISKDDLVLPSQHVHWNIDTVLASSAGAEGWGIILEIVAVGSLHAVNSVLKYIEEKMRKEELKLRLYESRSNRDVWFLEIRPTEAGKRGALEWYTAELGISMKEVVGIGDYRNDLEFCERSGYVVAMQNAVPELKKIADFITTRTCLEDGVEEFLGHFLTVRGVETMETPEARSGRARSR